VVYQAPQEGINDRNCGAQEPNSRLNSRPEIGGYVVKADGFQAVGQIWPDVGFVLEPVNL
jgi:hypothetical protein